MLIFEFMERWFIFIVLGIAYFPLVIWNHETGEYRGFFVVRTMLVMLMGLAAGLLFSWEREESSAETAVTLAFGCLLMYVIPRIWVECSHRIRFGVWLTVSGVDSRRNNDSN